MNYCKCSLYALTFSLNLPQYLVFSFQTPRTWVDFAVDFQDDQGIDLSYPFEAVVTSLLVKVLSMYGTVNTSDTNADICSMQHLLRELK